MTKKSLAWKLVRFIAGCHRIQTAKLFTAGKGQRYSRIRQECMWLLRDVAGGNVSKIARFFRRSKATVSASIGKIHDLMHCDSIPAVFKFKRRFFWLWCQTIRKYLRFRAVKVPMLPLRVRKKRWAKVGVS